MAQATTAAGTATAAAAVGSYGVTTKTSSSAGVSTGQHKSIWDMDGPTLDAWAKSLEGMFQPSQLQQESSSSSTNDKQKKGAATATNAAAVHKIAPDIATKAWSNLQTALSELQTTVIETTSSLASVDEVASSTWPSGHAGRQGGNVGSKASAATAAGATGSNKIKRRKGEILAVVDPYNIYRHTIRLPQDDDEDVKYVEDEAARDIKDTPGGKLTQLTISGLINGFAGVPGGIVKNKWLDVVDGVAPATTESIHSVGGASLTQLKYLANMFNQSIQTKVEADALITTPFRIHQILAPELSTDEIANIRSRVYETVGKCLVYNPCVRSDNGRPCLVC
jgi:hypothetical protein